MRAAARGAQPEGSVTAWRIERRLGRVFKRGEGRVQRARVRKKFAKAVIF